MRKNQLVPGLTWIGSGLASAVSLCADMALFMGFLALHVPPVSASALGYGCGVLIHWRISSRVVFVATAAPGGPARTRQKGLFLASALIGLALTTAIVALAPSLGLQPLGAKLIAIVASFQITYMLRKSVVFA
jgi:putative flippase GtrA